MQRSGGVKEKRCQFHQHFTCEFFVRTSFHQLFPCKCNYRKADETMFVQKICTYNVDEIDKRKGSAKRWDSVI